MSTLLTYSIFNLWGLDGIMAVIAVAIAVSILNRLITGSWPGYE